MSMTERTDATRQQRERKQESRQPDYVVRAKTGPGRKEWATIGYAWKRDRGEGFSVKLNTMPIGSDWNGVLKLLPPYVDEDADDASGEMFK
jgi:hypothetical protein